MNFAIQQNLKDYQMNNKCTKKFARITERHFRDNEECGKPVYPIN